MAAHSAGKTGDDGVRVAVLAQVAAEAQCLATTVPMLREIGEVTVFSADAGPEVTECAVELGAPVVPMPWRHHYGDLLTTVAGRLGGGPWIMAYADETPAARGARDWSARPGPAAVGVRHRTGERDTYTEENEARGCGPGTPPPRFTGLVYAHVVREGTVVDPDALPHTGIVLEHWPARWPGLTEQRIARTAEAYRVALANAPGDPELLYGLFHCHYSAHQWPEVRELAAVWRGAAGPDDERRPLVDYYEACAAVALRSTEDALRLAEEAVRRAPRFADGWYLTGELHAASGRFRAAEEAFRTAHGLGRDAAPVAVEDHSLATWRPLAALAALAGRDGRAEEAARLKAEARAARARLRAGEVVS
ncbi:lipopolysaccharide assembly protein LapB [Streptomyces sp. I05A-00742]|uniref:tetratricopeptide repeat protein n=1 Tax=Streptomyces sp. I05A-00742 TaxID=2732853 RepID=UPI001487F349|nr:tetratricopeptide repeat protein [Streptomyces sp. I05A-00742]